MQAEAVEPVASTSRLSEAASSLIAHAHSPLSRSPPRLPTQPDGNGNGGAHSDDQDYQEGDASHNGNKDRDKEKEKKRRTRNGCLVCRKRKKLCDEQKPTCGACSRLSLACAWEDRVQAALERRRRRIERMKLKEQEQEQRRGAAGLSSSSSSSKPEISAAKRKPGRQLSEDVAGGGGGGWDQQAAAVEMMQLDPLGYNPAAPGIYPPTSPSVSYQGVNSVPDPATTTAAAIMTPVENPAGGGAPLDSPHSWMPFLGSFAPAGYEPAAAPDPLAWSMTWPIGMGYSPYMTAAAMGFGGGGGGGGGSIVGQPPPGQHYLPVIGTTASAAQPLTTGETTTRVEAGSIERTSAAERDGLDLDALAQLEHVQSDLLLQSHVAADADLVRTSTSEEEEGGHYPATAPAAAAPNGSSPPFDLFALLRSPSPVHPFAAAAGAANMNGPAGVPFAFDPWGPAAVTSPIKLHPSSSVPQQQQQQLSTSSAAAARGVEMQNERGRQLQVGGKSELLPATVGHAASFLASSDWAFTQAYLLSHYTSSLARLVSIASSPAASDSASSGSGGGGGSDRSRSRRGRLSEQRQHLSSRPSSSHSHSHSHSRPRDSATARSTRASANLFLSLVPLANRHPYLLHAILSWSAANLAAASSSSSGGGGGGGGGGSAASGPGSGGGNSIMATLSDQLGHLADEEISAALPELEAYAARRANARSASVDGNRDRSSSEEAPPGNWEVLLAARLMLTQAAICQGAVDLWRVRLGEAAHVIDLVGGVAKCRTPLARQLVKNLLYHDVLSSTSRRDGLLLDYSFLRQGGGATPGSTAASGTSPAATTTTDATPTGETAEERRRREAEEDEEDVLDTLMGCAESVFLLVGRITSLAKEKRESLLASTGGGVPEDKLDDFIRQVDELRIELEREKERMDAFLIERPDLEPHRYFHEVFRLAALVYLHMLLELPPTSYPILLLVRKMLSLTEVIVSEGLPGLCSMHWPLFLMHLNSTPLVSPHAPTTSTTNAPPPSSSSPNSKEQQQTTTSPPAPPPPRAQPEPEPEPLPSLLSDRARSTALFDAHMHEFTFMNTKRSRLLIDEAWRRSQGGSRFVDPDSILDEWEWDLNWA